MDLEECKKVFHAINTCSITCNNVKCSNIISAITQWSYAHRCGNGMLSEVEQQACIDFAWSKVLYEISCRYIIKNGKYVREVLQYD
jgi:hypothetical protein